MANKKHAALIQAWLNGAKIQWRHNGTPWRDCDDDNPEWSPVIEYRVKPVEQEQEVNLVMTATEMYRLFISREGTTHDALSFVVGEALQRSLDKGLLVPRAEFDRAIGDRAARDMAVAKAVAVRCYWNVGDSLEAHKLHDRMTDDVLKDVISQVK